MSDPTTVDERYSSATHTSDLRVRPEKTGDADVMIAAGWCSSRLGMALLRLHSEYDGMQHPRKMTQDAIESYAATLDGPKPDRLRQAHLDASKWHLHEMGLMLGRLKSLPVVREQLALVADKWGMESPHTAATTVLMWWLDSVCHVCHGVKREQIEDTPILSDIVCQACRGSGETRLPHGQQGRRLANYIDECLYNARISLRKRLRG